MASTPPTSPPGEALQVLAERVRNAMQLILDVRSDAAHRASANTYCESLREHPQSLDLAFHLLEPTNALPLRNYAILLLESQQGRGPSRAAFGQRLWESLSVVLLPHNEHRLVVEKLARVCADVAIREWPHAWPQFAANVTDALSNGASAEFATHTLQRLVSILYGEDEFLPSEQKSRLKLAFEETMLLPSLRFLCAALSAPVQSEPLLECFMAFAPWAPFPSPDLIAMEKRLLQASRVDALMAISQAAASKGECPPHIAFLFGPEAMGMIHAFLNATVPNPDSYDTLKAFVDWLCFLGTQFVTKLASEDQRRAFISLMLALTRLPQLLIRSAVCLFWLGITKVEAMLPLVPVADLLLAAMEADSVESYKRSPMNAEDFESVDEYKSVAAATRSRFGDVVQHLGICDDGYKFMGSLFQQFVSQHAAGNLARPVADGAFIRQWTALCYFMEALFRGRRAAEHSAIVRLGLQVSPPPDPHVAIPWIALIKTGILAVDCNIELLPRALEVLFAAVRAPDGPKDRYDYMSMASRASQAICRVVEGAKPAVMTPLIPLFLSHVDGCIGTCRRADRRHILEAVLCLSASQAGIANAATLRGMSAAVHSQIAAAIETCRLGSEDEETRGAVQDTLALILSAQKHHREDAWERFAKAVIAAYPAALAARKHEEWRESVLAMSWPCLHALVPMRLLIEQTVQHYSTRLQGILLRVFLRPLAAARCFDPALMPVIRAFSTPLFRVLDARSINDDDVEAVRAFSNLRTALIGFTHDVLCTDMASPNAPPIADYTVEMPSIKTPPRTPFLMQLTPTELARRFISDADLMASVLGSFVDAFASLATPSRAATITVAVTMKITQCMQHYLPMFYTGELLPQAQALQYLYHSFLPHLLDAIRNQSIAEQQTHHIALLTEVIKWSWMLGLESHLPFDTRLLRERFSDQEGGTGLYMSLKSQRKNVKKILFLGDATRPIQPQSASGGKSMLARLKEYVETGASSTPSTNTMDEPFLVGLFE